MMALRAIAWWCRIAYAGSALGSILLAHGALAQTAGAPAGRPGSPRGDSASAAQVRLRVIGVFDEESGEPLEGVDVTDFFTGISSRTTKTGTTALILNGASGTLIRLKKVGYQPITLPVRNAPQDTTPITTMLIRAGHVLPAVITVGDRTIVLGKSDTVSALLRNGFYERRETGGAPRSAFISGDKLQGTSLLTNARYFGRAICESNVYIDGIKVSSPQRVGGRFLKEGIDQLIDPSQVAGIETYTGAELPAGTTHTMQGPGTFDPAAAAANAVANVAGTLPGHSCVTFIWLRD